MADPGPHDIAALKRYAQDPGFLELTQKEKHKVLARRSRETFVTMDQGQFADFLQTWDVDPRPVSPTGEVLGDLAVRQPPEMRRTPGLAEKAISYAPDVPRYVAGTVGGVLGGAAGAPGGPGFSAAGAAKGAALLGGAGEAYSQFVQQLPISEQAKSAFLIPGVGPLIYDLAQREAEAAGDPDKEFFLPPPPGFLEAATDIPLAAAELGATELLAGGVFKALSFGVGKLPFLTPLGRRTEAAKSAERLGIPVLQSEARGGTPAEGLEAISSGSLAGRKILQKKYAQQSAATIRVAGQIGEQIGRIKDPQEAGRATGQALKEAAAYFKAQNSIPYRKIDELVSKKVRVTGQQDVTRGVKGYTGPPIMIETTEDTIAWVPTEGLKKFALRFKDRYARIEEVLKTSDDTKQVLEFTTKVADLASHITFDEAQVLRSVMAKHARSSPKLFNDRLAGTEARSRVLIETAMDRGAKNAGIPQVMPMLKAADKQFAKDIKLFNETIVDKVVQRMKNNPEGLAQLVWRQGLGGEFGPITTAQDVRLALRNNPGAWDEVRRAGYEDIISRAIEGEVADVGGRGTPISIGVFNAAKAHQIYSDLGEAVQKELAGGNAKEIDTLFRALTGIHPERARSLRGGEVGMFERSIITRGMVGGGAFGAGSYYGGPSAGISAAATILLFPRMAARLLTLPAGIRLLKEGTRLPANAKNVMRIASRAATFELQAQRKKGRAKDRTSERPSPAQGRPTGQMLRTPPL